MSYTFTTDCIGSTGDRINAMRDRATESTLADMREWCSDFEEVTSRLGYDGDFPIDTDWHVSYHRSEYAGSPCLYFVWSAIEYVFTTTPDAIECPSCEGEGDTEVGHDRWLTCEQCLGTGEVEAQKA